MKPDNRNDGAFYGLTLDLDPVYFPVHIQDCY